MIEFCKERPIQNATKEVKLLLGNSRSLPMLLNLPNEILDEIASYLLLPKDLSFLSQSCKRIHLLAVPKHLHGRHVAVSLSDRSFWFMAMEKKSMTSLIRALCIYDRDPVQRESDGPE